MVTDDGDIFLHGGGAMRFKPHVMSDIHMVAVEPQNTRNIRCIYIKNLRTGINLYSTT